MLYSCWNTDFEIFHSDWLLVNFRVFLEKTHLNLTWHFYNQPICFHTSELFPFFCASIHRIRCYEGLYRSFSNTLKRGKFQESKVDGIELYRFQIQKKPNARFGFRNLHSRIKCSKYNFTVKKSGRTKQIRTADLYHVKVTLNIPSHGNELLYITYSIP